jgi:three-Cys-motif partner protein
MSGQGNGHWSARKERGFHASLWVSLQISMGDPSFPFWYADLNAGCGWNQSRGCDGSPVVFLKCARDFCRHYRAFFCDCDAGALQQLRHRLTSDLGPSPGSIQLEEMDNADFLPLFAQKIRAVEDPKYAFGAILVDPNGFPHGFPLPALGRFSEEFPRLDIILNVNARLLRNAIAYREKKNPNWGVRWPATTVLEIADQVSRPYWTIRNPPPNGHGDYFITLVGRGIRHGAQRDLGFFHLDTPIGQRIAREMKHVEVEQRLLFEEGPDT